METKIIYITIVLLAIAFVLYLILRKRKKNTKSVLGSGTYSFPLTLQPSYSKAMDRVDGLILSRIAYPHINGNSHIIGNPQLNYDYALPTNHGDYTGALPTNYGFPADSGPNYHLENEEDLTRGDYAEAIDNDLNYMEESNI